MTEKSSFTNEEWKLLVESAMLAGIAVTAAEPSGLWGTLKESFAGSTAMARAKMDPGSNPLVRAVVAELETSEGRAVARDGMMEKFSGAKSPEIKTRCVETLRQVGALLDSKAPGDAPAFKEWLRGISRNVAEAAKEGGFMGIGGVPVSESEKATLTEIASALKLAA